MQQPIRAIAGANHIATEAVRWVESLRPAASGILANHAERLRVCGRDRSGSSASRWRLYVAHLVLFSGGRGFGSHGDARTCPPVDQRRARAADQLAARSRCRIDAAGLTFPPSGRPATLCVARTGPDRTGLPDPAESPRRPANELELGLSGGGPPASSVRWVPLAWVERGPKSKHCSACNKCVADFDHHCRWLNNCVGSRNYKLFLCSVVSAVLGVCVLLAVSSYVLIRFFWEPDDPGVDKHSRAPNRTTTSPFPSPPLSAVPALAAVTGALALLACVLLCHLLLFHFYLMWNRLSTYEYIVRQRHRQDRRQTTIPDDVKHAARASGRSEGMDDSETPGYTRPQLDERRERLVGDAWAAASPLPNAPPTISTQHHTAECPPYAQKAFSQKTMTTKKKRKMGGHGAVVADAGPDARCSSERAGAWLPGPPVARPPRLHQHLPPSPPVRATAPPAEYHSDSAESLEEVPMVLDKLGSRAPWRTSVFVSGASEGRMPSAPSSSSSWFPPIAGRRR
ncbi:palmitoyltransferase ZDHHC1 isoform X4 [Syngnathus scovelli]|uniref:palmitoyltransferase ZDHHC1 isoform X4 n=1 Tax=Syngnathus scovelli TaxID=161590 RepID=UPI002110B6E0|nr:palmitoyltransferase ZDHHC1 isoform X4 [Syngnathus scovelli]